MDSRELCTLDTFHTLLSELCLGTCLAIANYRWLQGYLHKRGNYVVQGESQVQCLWRPFKKKKVNNTFIS